MARPFRRASLVTGLVALASLVAFAGPAAATSPQAAAARAAERARGLAATAAGPYQVVASGLNNPRGLGFGPDGALYVAEAGAGGPGPCQTGPEGDEVCFGSSGAVTRVWRGTQHRVLSHLPSLADPGGIAATGPADVSFLGATQYVAVQHPGGGPESRAPFGPAGAAFGRLLRVSGGHVRFVADLARFEAARNPDGGAVDSDPYAVLALPGRQIVADAAGNDLLRVNPDGSISVLGVFPSRLVTAPPEAGLPPGAKIPMEAVPTTVTRGPDGAYYVGELTGFPFLEGAARVWRVVPGHRPQVYARGFTNIIDIAFDGRGRLNVLEITRNGLLQAEGPGGDLSGALIRVNRDGSRQTLASDGLVTPTGFVIAADGAFYVSNFGIFPGSDPSGQLPGTGQVVRVPRR
jgi:hypothetical protein